MYSIYQVMEGETLEDVANKVGISMDELISINGISNGMVKPLDYVVIPNRNNENMYFKRYTISKGDTIYSIARRYGVNHSDLLRLNGLNNEDTIYPGDVIFVPKDGVSFYVTGMDDTLLDVSQKMGATPNELSNMNSTIYLTNDQLLVYKK